MPTGGQLRVGVSGHRGLPADTARLVKAALAAELDRLDPGELVGVTLLADGADQLFAEAVLEHAGRLEVIVPAAKYRDGLPAPYGTVYDALLARASTVDRLPFLDSTEEAHMLASEAMLERIDRLFAVWDGQPARGYGGTADVVQSARQRNVPVTVVWPPGAHRD
jgi:hypothetical protein